MKRIIGITGRIGSGKTLVARHIAERHGGAPILKFSDILLDILTRMHLRPTRKNFQKIGLLLRKGLGREIIVHAMLQDLRGSEAELIVIDGFRYPNEVSMLRHFEGSILIAIEAPIELRYERIVVRGEKAGETKKTFDEFCASEKAQTERQIGDVIARADYKIDNTGTKEDLLNQIDEILEKN